MQLLSESNALNLIFPKLALCAAAVTGVTGFTEPVPSLPRLVSSSQTRHRSYRSYGYKWDFVGLLVLSCKDPRRISNDSLSTTSV